MRLSILEMNQLGGSKMLMKNHEQAGIIERRAKMRESIELELSCAAAGYEKTWISRRDNHLGITLTSTWTNSSKR